MYLITSFTPIHPQPEIHTMKLLPTFKSVKALVLATATVATTLVGNIAPSTATLANRVISAPGKPEVVIFESNLQSVAIGCPALRNLWRGLPTQSVSVEEFQRIITATPTRLVAHLNCNNPAIKGFVSPAFGSDKGAIIAGGALFLTKTTDFFNAMGIKPTALSQEEGRNFLNQNRHLDTNITLEPQFVANPATAPGTVTFINRGIYVATYTLTYNILNTSRRLDTGNVLVNQKSFISNPPLEHKTSR
ncbi:MAG: hypothetical protein HC778_03800 [Chamaesiphon sp. CSU_1_12]|nr:hypothetical protein [Chamaesiphon sp. CSU_1_12]